MAAIMDVVVSERESTSLATSYLLTGNVPLGERASEAGKGQFKVGRTPCGFLTASAVESNFVDVS